MKNRYLLALILAATMALTACDFSLPWEPALPALATEPAPIVTPAANATGYLPANYPDGPIVFIKDNDLYVMDIYGQNQVRLTNDSYFDDHPVWSPDGSKIAFTSYRNENGDIYIIDPLNGTITQITNDPSHDWQPAWSPDGQKIAFISDRNDPGDLAEIFIYDLFTAQITQLTDSIQDQIALIQGSPSWSANDVIAYTSSTEGCGLVLRPSSGGSPTCKNIAIGDGRISSPVWSHSQTMFDVSLDGFQGVYIYNLITDQTTKIPTPKAGNVFGFSWSSDDRQIMASYYGANLDFYLYLINIDGSGIRQISDITDITEFSWLQRNGGAAPVGTSTPSFDEAEVRYILADIQLGNVADYYRQFLDQPNVAEAIRRWDAGITVTNIDQFERKLVGGTWQVVYAGTETLIDGKDVLLTSDPQP
jgi:Tol biopolymer transport system component